ncbi:MAG: phosphoenolpyruvate carboxylase, partial [Nitrospiraceae bacterium]|nr:phosphoenolpyruvate carboxylase [Nitrospiraceae bacterium]
PFRGGLSPWNVPHFIEEYPGVRTVTVQSAFRYDYPQEDVREAINLLNRSLPGTVPLAYTPEEVSAGERLVTVFSEHYQQTVEEVADVINRISASIPPRRERKLHIGLFGYSRGIGQKHLPRAIGFTASLYSLGIPPELIGTGRGIAQAIREGYAEPLSLFYRRLKDDMQEAGHYLNKENLTFLASENQGWASVKEDIELIEDFFKIELGPVTIEHYLHRNFVSSIYFLMQEEKDFSEYLLKAALLRRSLG